ncbi:MAG: hypothetical protein AABZ08_01945 [Planctomycetota bacterium]
MVTSESTSTPHSNPVIQSATDLQELRAFMPVAPAVKMLLLMQGIEFMGNCVLSRQQAYRDMRTYRNASRARLLDNQLDGRCPERLSNYLTDAITGRLPSNSGRLNLQTTLSDTSYNAYNG